MSHLKYFSGTANSTDNFPIWEDGRNPPWNFTLTTNAENPDGNGIFNLFWTPSINADNYSVYVHDSYITDIDQSISLLGSGITSNLYPVQIALFGIYYFILVAYNVVGNITSNCIQVIVGK